MSTAKDPTTLVSPDSWAANLKPGDMILENKTQIHHLVICRRGNFIDHCESDGFSETRVDWLEANYQFKRSGNPKSFLTEIDILTPLSDGNFSCGGINPGKVYMHCSGELRKVQDILVNSSGVVVRFFKFGEAALHHWNLDTFKSLHRQVSIDDEVKNTATP